jgi:hypothetical protein
MSLLFLYFYFLSDYLHYYRSTVPNNGTPGSIAPAVAVVPGTQTSPGGTMAVQQRGIFGAIFRGITTVGKAIGKAVAKGKAKKAAKKAAKSAVSNSNSGQNQNQ